MSSTEAGFSILEVILAAAVITTTSLSLVYATHSSKVGERGAEQAVRVQESLTTVRSQLEDVADRDLLSWHGASEDRGDHTVVVDMESIEVGLVRITLTATDDASGTVIHRLGHYRFVGSTP